MDGVVSVSFGFLHASGLGHGTWRRLPGVCNADPEARRRFEPLATYAPATAVPNEHEKTILIGQTATPVISRGGEPGGLEGNVKISRPLFITYGWYACPAWKHDCQINNLLSCHHVNG